MREELFAALKRASKNTVYSLLGLGVAVLYLTYRFGFGGQEAPTCSSAEVVETVKEIAEEQLAKNNYVITALVKAKAMSLAVESIRTVSRSDNKASCKAVLKTEINMPLIKKDNEIAYGLLVAAKGAETDKIEGHLDIDYSAQNTDDGNHVYVEVTIHQ